jgi:hypothetical protein
MGEPLTLAAGELAARPLAGLADEADFNRVIEDAAAAIADRFALKVHLNIVARRRAYADWIDRVCAEEKHKADHRALIAICAGLIEALGRRRVVGYSAMLRHPANRMAEAIVKYGSEVTALAIGAAIYARAVEGLTGEDPGEPLPALLVENAAANLRRHPEAAAKFRELLRLSTPWM